MINEEKIIKKNDLDKKKKKNENENEGNWRREKWEEKEIKRE